MDIQEYLDEVNEVADALEAEGNVNALEQLYTTVVSVGIQLGVELTFDWNQYEIANPYLDTVPP